MLSTFQSKSSREAWWKTKDSCVAPPNRKDGNTHRIHRNAPFLQPLKADECNHGYRRAIQWSCHRAVEGPTGIGQGSPCRVKISVEFLSDLHSHDQQSSVAGREESHSEFSRLSVRW